MKKRNRKPNASRLRQPSYQQLENRNLLATSAAFFGGALDIQLDAANDVAVVDVNNSGNVTINGNDQIDVGGGTSTVAASSVAELVSAGNGSAGQELSLAGELNSLRDVELSSIDLISIAGQYNLDKIEVNGAGSVTQTANSTLGVSLTSTFNASGSVTLDSLTNDFDGAFSAVADNITVSDIDNILLGSISTLGNFDVKATRIAALLAPISVGGDLTFTAVDEVSLFETPLVATNVTIKATSDLSNVTLEGISARGDVYVSGGSIVGTGTWLVSGSTTLESIAGRTVEEKAVNMGGADILTNDYRIIGGTGDVVLGDSTVLGNGVINSLRFYVEQNSVNDDGLASSTGGLSSISVGGDLSINSSGSVDAVLSSISSENLTVISRTNDVTLGIATTVVGDLEVSSGGTIDAGSVTVTGSADINADEDITINLETEGNSEFDAGGDIFLNGLESNAAKLNAAGQIENLANAVVNIDGTLELVAKSASLGNKLNDSVVSARVLANVDEMMEIIQESDVRLLNISAGTLSVASKGTITNRADATIMVPGDAFFEGTNIVIGQTDNDTFNAGRLRFVSDSSVSIDEDSDTSFFGDSSAHLVDIESKGDITDAENASLNVAFSTLFEAENVTIGDTGIDTFNTRTLSFKSPGHVNISEDSRIFLTNQNSSDQLTLTTNVSILDAPTAEISIAGEAKLNTPYANVGDNTTDTFNAGSVSFGSSNTINLSENSDTVFSGGSDIRLAIVRSEGSISNAAGASLQAKSSSLFADNNIELGTKTGDNININRLRFVSPSDVTINQDDSVYIFGNNTANQLTLVADGPIGDSGTASFNIANHTMLKGTSIWIGEQTTDTFNTGSLTVDATGGVIIGENSSMLLAGISSAFGLTLSADGDLEDERDADTVVKNFVTLAATSVTLGDSIDDCFDLLSGAANLQVDATDSNVNLGCS